MSSPPNKQGYLSGLASYSPWSSRSATPKPPAPDKKHEDPTFEPQRGGDHSVSKRHRLSLKQYPSDCPPLVVRWFHAVDIPKRKPLQTQTSEGKAAPQPKKYVPFSERDSRAIEHAYQKGGEQDDVADRERLAQGQAPELDRTGDIGLSADDRRGTKLRRTAEEQEDTSVKVPVNEDFLFDVDVERRELAPAYWLGPVYDCRRGTWFATDGSSLKPLDENLATQLEEGYLKLKPWRFPKEQPNKSSPQASKPRSRPSSFALDSKKSVTPKNSNDSLKGHGDTAAVPNEAIQRTFRLFGAHMNSVVTYQDEKTAWIMSDDFLSGMRGTMYERFAGAAHYAGLKVVRGFTDATPKKESKDNDKPVDSSPRLGSEEKLKEKEAEKEKDEDIISPSLSRRITLERQMSSLVESGAFESRESEEEELRKRDEKEIENDYVEADGDEQGREIEHLILVTHGIGQQLGLRFESVNFIHDVNTLRKTLKSVYSNSPDLQALNAEVGKPQKNCRIQVLPICWRHLLDFPKQSLKYNRKEHDLGDAHEEEDEKYPSIDDITVNNVFRSFITDLALDILLYQSPAYKIHITRIVLNECNRIFRLFKQRNPNFKGKVSLMGHSLGSAIMFDILCNQKADTNGNRRHSMSSSRRKTDDEMQFEFPVEDFYALGSPIGLFQMLKGRTIAARTPNVKPAQTPFSDIDDPFATRTESNYFENTTSSPKCQRLYNIFHPTDPISYRLEPLITPAMSNMKPQPLPYTKKGLFGNPAQGMAGIGARVGQSVSGLWTGLTSGIASSLLSRSLGISADDPTKSQQGKASSRNQATNTSANGAGNVAQQSGPFASSDAEKLIRGDLTVRTGEDGQHPPTLLDDEIETLYSGFKKQSVTSSNPLERDDQRRDIEEQARKLKREEAKVRALNSNGRVDYSIQEGAFDLSLLAGIASHLSYWAEEDVSHFVISQLLSRHRVLRNETQRKGDA
ncbi:uncharacterized protein PV09_05753 [Verruconis gallopava]|uniref:DDHD domain-containing protein n=1 Tax=Verruconis gallopava TaxID=253628 RepID=A0A0D2A8N2_9PEZI|nr:uncharacterized protein PV09_05753 [Verruconis gallopava]KIW03108.1 hypothetical protein PV09_05753 [Verruconis gallopava]